MTKSYYADIDAYEVEDNKPNPVGYGLAEYEMHRFGRTRVITGKEKIEQSMRMILDTQQGSRFFLPLFGSKLYLLFDEPNDFIAKDLAELYVREAIELWEPRVVLVDVTATVNPVSTVIGINIEYRMKDSNSVESFIYSMNRQIPEMR